MAGESTVRDRPVDWMHDLVVPESMRYQKKQVKPVESKPMATAKPLSGNTEQSKQLKELEK